MSKIIEWDAALGQQIERDATPQELANMLILAEEAQEALKPQSVTPRQAKLALASAGVYDDILNVLETLPEPQKTFSKIEWDYATEFKRSHMLVHQMKQAMNWTDEFVDELFVTASTL